MKSRPFLAAISPARPHLRVAALLYESYPTHPHLRNLVEIQTFSGRDAFAEGMLSRPVPFRPVTDGPARCVREALRTACPRSRTPENTPFPPSSSSFPRSCSLSLSFTTTSQLPSRLLTFFPPSSPLPPFHPPCVPLFAAGHLWLALIVRITTLFSVPPSRRHFLHGPSKDFPSNFTTI